MIRDVWDVAVVLCDALTRATAGEANASEPRKSAFAVLQPPRAVFTVQTVEGSRFRVTVEEEP